MTDFLTTVSLWFKKNYNHISQEKKYAKYLSENKLNI